MNKKDNTFLYVKRALKTLGYKTTKPRHINANGADLFAIKNDRVLSVEVKKARIANKNRNVLRIDPVEENRKKDDLIAIVHPTKYVLIENMNQHLRLCNKSGQRFLSF